MANQAILAKMQTANSELARKAGADPMFIPIDIRGLGSMFEPMKSYKVKLQFNTFSDRVITPVNDERSFASFEVGLIHNGAILPDVLSLNATDGYCLTLHYGSGLITEDTEFEMLVGETTTRRGSRIKTGTLFVLYNGVKTPIAGLPGSKRFSELVKTLSGTTQQTTPPEPQQAQQAQQPVGTTTGF